MSQPREVVEEIVLLYRCETCDYINKHSFVTKFDETITQEEELKKVLESIPCRHCRFEKLKFYEKLLIVRIRNKG